jgi:hypothetical protein
MCAVLRAFEVSVEQKVLFSFRLKGTVQLEGSGFCGLIRHLFIKGRERHVDFLANFARPPFCESPLKLNIGLSLFFFIGIWKPIGMAAMKIIVPKG